MNDYLAAMIFAFVFLFSGVIGFFVGKSISDDGVKTQMHTHFIVNTNRPPAVGKMSVDSPSIDVELECLAKNIYFESANQSEEGKIAVAMVVMNRVDDKRYPNTICGVVKQKHQFSWLWDGKSDTPNPKDPQWKESKRVAKHVIMRYNMYDDNKEFLFGATHYHADYVNPKWASKKDRIAKIGDHIFYR